MSGNVSFHKLVLLDQILHTGQVTTIIIMGQGSFHLKRNEIQKSVNNTLT